MSDPLSINHCCNTYQIVTRHNARTAACAVVSAVMAASVGISHGVRKGENLKEIFGPKVGAAMAVSVMVGVIYNAVLERCWPAEETITCAGDEKLSLSGIDLTNPVNFSQLTVVGNENHSFMNKVRSLKVGAYARFCDQDGHPVLLRKESDSQVNLWGRSGDPAGRGIDIEVNADGMQSVTTNKLEENFNNFASRGGQGSEIKKHAVAMGVIAAAVAAAVFLPDGETAAEIAGAAAAVAGVIVGAIFGGVIEVVATPIYNVAVMIRSLYQRWSLPGSGSNDGYQQLV